MAAISYLCVTELEERRGIVLRRFQTCSSASGCGGLTLALVTEVLLTLFLVLLSSAMSVPTVVLLPLCSAVAVVCGVDSTGGEQAGAVGLWYGW